MYFHNITLNSDVMYSNAIFVQSIPLTEKVMSPSDSWVHSASVIPMYLFIFKIFERKIFFLFDFDLLPDIEIIQIFKRHH